MSKTMDNLESLSNDDLRVRLLEFGFPNMPVTTTTRNLLIKKLRNHVEGEKNKTRRETIHVVKYSSGEESDGSDATKGKKNTATVASKDNRRATIGVAANAMKPPAKMTNRRRSGRNTPSAASNDFNGAALAPTVPDIIEDTDEEENIPKSKPATNSTAGRRSKSKTPTQAKVTLIKVVQEPTLEDVIEDNEYHDEFIRPRNRSPVINDVIQPSQRYSPVKLSYDNGTTSATTTRKRLTISGPGYNSESTKLVEPTFTSKPFSTTTSRQSISTSYNRYNPTISSPSIASRTNFGNYSATKTKPAVSYEDDDDETEEDVAEDDSKPVYESRYLNEFSKRLAQLRDEPIPEPPLPKLDTNIYTTEYASPRLNSYPGIHSRRSVARQTIPENNSVFHHFKAFWSSLNQKYNLNRNLLILFILLVIVFIIVLVFF